MAFRWWAASGLLVDAYLEVTTVEYNKNIWYVFLYNDYDCYFTQRLLVFNKTWL